MASDPLARVPAFGICPPLRCCHRLESSPGAVCGDVARWQRPGNHLFLTTFFCNLHRQSGDMPIGPIAVVRRVRIGLDVLFAATSTDDPQARAEALARLEAAVIGAGGVLDIQSVRSSVGRYGG